MRSVSGVIAGVLMLGLLLTYAGIKMGIMLEFGDNIVQEPHIENFFDKEFSFNTAKGFELAFTVSAYNDSEQGDPLDDSYGKIVAK